MYNFATQDIHPENVPLCLLGLGWPVLRNRLLVESLTFIGMRISPRRRVTKSG